MAESSAPFSPDWASPPGDSILDLAEERGWTQAELAGRLGYTEKHVSQLVNGKVPLSVDAALRHEAGVLLVLVPAIPRAHVSGVACWLTPARPLIQLSLYGKTNDKFWFTFLHEAAHILLHATSKQEKKTVFLDDPNASHTDDPHEHEANNWAGDWLFPRRVTNPPLRLVAVRQVGTGFAELRYDMRRSKAAGAS